MNLTITASAAHLGHLLSAGALALVFTANAFAQSTAFTYQGRLNYGVNPATGIYDFRFTLYDASGGSGVVAGPQTNAATGVSNGLFTTTLDFGTVFDGNSRWLEIAVRTNGSGTFVPMNPRQQVTPTPQALYAATAASANSVAAANIVGTVPLAQLPTALVTNNQSGVTLRGAFTGDGGGLTNVTANALTGEATNALLRAFAPNAAFTLPPRGYGHPTPLKTAPMGWNAWNQFGCGVNESLFTSTVDTMAANGLRAAGYTNCICIDDGWMTGRDGNGTPIADPVRFPQGMKYLGDYAHARGFAFGIWTPLSIYGSVTSSGCGTNFVMGSLGYETNDAAYFASIGVDYLKLDNMGTPSMEASLHRMRQGVEATGRPMHIMTVGYAFWWPQFMADANQVRVSTDIRPTWEHIRAQVEAADAAAAYQQPGYWNDPDMLEVGVTNGWGSLTYEEAVSHFSLWCIMGSPLMLGCDVTKLSAPLLALVSHPGLLAINQDANCIQGRRISIVKNATGSLETWAKPLGVPNSGTNAVLLLNNSQATGENGFVYVYFRDLGIAPGARVWNVFHNCEILSTSEGLYPDCFRATLAPHQSLMLRVVGKPIFGAVVYAKTPSQLSDKDTGVTLSGTFLGNGAGLSNLSADAVTGGLTINLAVLVPGGGTNTLCFTNGILRAIQ